MTEELFDADKYAPAEPPALRLPIETPPEIVKWANDVYAALWRLCVKGERVEVTA